MFKVKKISLVVCLILLVSLSFAAVVSAEENDTMAESEEAVSSAEETEAVEEAEVVEESTTETVVAEAEDAKFRAGPTVVLRPVEDEISADKDGLIEVYMDNPIVNDANLHVDIKLQVPSGLHVYGEGFAQSAAAGVAHGVFSIPPGIERSIYVTVKASQTGDFTLHLNGLYYPGNNKDNYHPLSFTYPITVTEVSLNPEEAPTEEVQAEETVDKKSVKVTTETAPGFSLILASVVIGFVSVFMKRKDS